jgi:hypothetical protein
MGGTRVVREEPGKQKPRSAVLASRLRDCGRGNSPEAAPEQMRGGKGADADIQLRIGVDADKAFGMKFASPGHQSVRADRADELRARRIQAV